MKKDSEWLRRTAIERADDGEDHKAIWTSLGKSRAWFYKWLKRSRQGAPDWFRERSPGPDIPANRTAEEIEEIVQFARSTLYNRELFSGAQAISWQLKEWDVTPVPSLRTINRILRRHDLTHKRTGRYRPKGVPYPAPEAIRPNAVHQADFIGPRFLNNGTDKRRFYVLNCVDIATGRCAVQALTDGKSTTDAALWRIWRRLGLPKYLQVDNEMTFAGSPNSPRSLGPLVRLCLPLGVEPVFIPVREPWRNGVIEKFQGFWDQRVWQKQALPDVAALYKANEQFEKKHNRDWRYTKLKGKTPLQTLADAKVSLEYPQTPKRPKEWPAQPEAGRYHLIRFIRGNGKLNVFGELFQVDPDLRYEYVWATVDIEKQRLHLMHDGEQVDDWKYTTT